jgi:hypothetical protein
MGERILTWLNRFLVLDVFLVLAGVVWLAIAVIGRSLGLSLGLELWYRLWQPLFNPAIGILCLGAILSWLVSKISARFT